MIQECECCQYTTNCREIKCQTSSGHVPRILCDICINTLTSTFNGYHRAEAPVMQTLVYCTHLILDAIKEVSRQETND